MSLILIIGSQFVGSDRHFSEDGDPRVLGRVR
jgi:hypothetical protein